MRIVSKCVGKLYLSIVNRPMSLEKAMSKGEDLLKKVVRECV